ncbi:DsrE family protein [Robbsia sp. Bb-Pol-6]|uniref:DsrE family protein n=1 Tax=Robbsia betulipollinis TaxID=2981849 RepID=A0ABT3ZPG3_9BURK|nr:DsrE family protein [Robbsia betulipollinis]MCY0388431.1 DsrE family protein [Robbsia betulipollinis]
MNKRTMFLAAALSLSALTCHAQSSTEGFWTTPTIAGYGKMHALPKAAYQPQAEKQYKIVFALTQGAKTPSAVNPGLDHVARTVNLYVASGVPIDHLKFVAVAYGAATPLALNDTQYRAKFGVANPNLPLIAALKAHGIDVSVCGQAVAEHHFKYDWLDKQVTLALSGLTTVTTLESGGYVLMPL